MDPQHLLRAESCLTSLARQGYAILVVLHDLLAASRIVDAAILLDSGGTLRASGPAADILTPDILSQVFQARFQATAQGPMLLRA
jgi:iron complex transport system ATP-binding protein